MEAKKEVKAGSIVEKALEQESVIKTMEKLKKDKLEISLNPKQYLLEYSKAELKKLDETNTEGMNEIQLKAIEAMKESHKSSIVDYEKAHLDAYLVPLKYRDLQAVKDSVLEAMKYAIQFNWDEDIKIRAMIREEHTMTVYLALRKKEDVTKRYYNSLEEIAKETDTTIEQIYAKYLDSFVLTDEERKNS